MLVAFNISTYSVHMAQTNAAKDFIRVVVNVLNAACAGVNLNVFVLSCAFGLERFVCRACGVLAFRNMSCLCSDFFRKPCMWS